MLLTLTNVIGSTIIGATGATGPVPPAPMMIFWNTSYSYVPNTDAEDAYSTNFYFKFNIPDQI